MTEPSRAAGAQFDDHVQSYCEDVDASISFIGKDTDYFARRKADELIDVVEAQLGPAQGLSVLDVGCGVGATDHHLTGRVGELHGVDVASGAVAAAREANPAATYRVYDGTALPYDDGAFDVAFTACVLHHIDPHRRAAFSVELGRVVRPGGLVVVFEHNPFNPLTRLAVSRCAFDDGVVLLSRREVSALLDRAGLRVQVQRYVLFVPLDGPRARRVDRALARVPLGGQHCVVGQKSAGQAPHSP